MIQFPYYQQFVVSIYQLDVNVHHRLVSCSSVGRIPDAIFTSNDSHFVVLRDGSNCFNISVPCIISNDAKQNPNYYSIRMSTVDDKF